MWRGWGVFIGGEVRKPNGRDEGTGSTVTRPRNENFSVEAVRFVCFRGKGRYEARKMSGVR